MRPKERRETGQSDLFRARLDQIVDPSHPLVRLAACDRLALPRGALRGGLRRRSRPAALADPADGGAWPSSSTCTTSPTRCLCERWIENPYFQLFCGEEFFQHQLPFDRSSLTRWRQRMGEDKLVALFRRAFRSRPAPAPRSRPTSARSSSTPRCRRRPSPSRPTPSCMHRARERLVRLAKQHGVSLRQSYARVGKRAADPAPALCACQAVQAGQQGAPAPAHHARAGDPGHRPQDRRPPRARRGSSPGRLRWPGASRTSASASAAARSIRCTRPRSSASARARCRSPDFLTPDQRPIGALTQIWCGAGS